MTKRKKPIVPLFTDYTWNFELIEKTLELLPKYARELKLQLYPNQIELITSDQMIDMYASSGLPINYRHWSFGKKYSFEKESYDAGKSGLAYELVLNTNPCINYLMEENTACLQVLVLAHAGFGHNSFFKTNYLFKMWTEADSIIDYLLFSKDYIARCEEKYGIKEVEQIIDIAHSLQFHSIDKYKRKSQSSLKKEIAKYNSILKHNSENYNYVLDTLSSTKKNTAKEVFVDEDTDLDQLMLEFPEENFLYFIEKHSNILEKWEKEILRIVRKLGQYFYPQMLTKCINEGWACFVHYYMMTRLHDDGHINDGGYMEFLSNHTAVVNQRPLTRFNPYYLGFNIFMDIKRICLEPTEEDYKWFPDIAGNENWVNVMQDVIANYRDESFIRQFLSPHLIRKLQMVGIRDNMEDSIFEIIAHSDDEYYRSIRNTLADQYLPENYFPEISIASCNLKGSNTMYLEYNEKNEKKLDGDSLEKMLYNIHSIWGHDVIMKNQNGELLCKIVDGNIRR